MGTFKVIWTKMLNLPEKVDDTHEAGENFSGVIRTIFFLKKRKNPKNILGKKNVSEMKD